LTSAEESGYFSPDFQWMVDQLTAANEILELAIGIAQGNQRLLEEYQLCTNPLGEWTLEMRTSRL
jgi:hypothetical protein